MLIEGHALFLFFVQPLKQYGYGSHWKFRLSTFPRVWLDWHRKKVPEGCPKIHTRCKGTHAKGARAVRKIYFPKPDTPVLEFIAENLPRISGELLAIKPGKWFSTEAPTTDAACLLTRPIPNNNFIRALESTIGQAWFDGSRCCCLRMYHDAGRQKMQDKRIYKRF